jgi:tetratricopeptide (TPR) repeat protein
MQYMAERFLYLPLIGWLIAIAAIVPARKQIIAASFALISIWAVTAWNRSWIWQDEIALFVRSSIDSPKTPRIRENAVAAIQHLDAVSKCLDSAGNPNASISDTERKDALDALETGTRLFPDEPRLLNSYGVCLTGAGQLEKALPVFEKAVQLDPHDLEFMVNLARARVDAGQLSQAKATLQQAESLGPDAVDFLQVELKCFWLQEDYVSARAVLLKLHRLAPSPDNDYWLSEVEKKLAASGSKQTP